MKEWREKNANLILEKNSKLENCIATLTKRLFFIMSFSVGLLTCLIRYLKTMALFLSHFAPVADASSATQLIQSFGEHVWLSMITILLSFSNSFLQNFLNEKNFKKTIHSSFLQGLQLKLINSFFYILYCYRLFWNCSGLLIF